MPFEEYGSDGVEAVDMLNRGQYEQRFTSYLLKTLPDVMKRLEAGGRVLDVGCGVRRVALTIAKAFPQATAVGLDTDPESIRQANAAADAAGLSARIRFLARRIGDLDSQEKFDLITACDCIHNFVDPIGTLKEIRGLLSPEGVLFIVEPKAADRLEDNRNSIATIYYGFSIFHCMTQSLAQGGPGLGTCLGPARTEKLLREAGFTQSEILEIKSLVQLFYAARP